MCANGLSPEEGRDCFCHTAETQASWAIGRRCGVSVGRLGGNCPAAERDGDTSQEVTRSCYLLLLPTLALGKGLRMPLWSGST